MLRRVFTLATAISMLLFVAAVVLWVRSYRTRDWLQLSHAHWGVEAVSDGGELGMDWRAASDPQDLGEGRADQTSAARRLHPPNLVIGFGRTIAVVTDRDGKNIGKYAVYWFPHWLLVVLFGILPGVWIARISRGTWRTPERCRNCGYVLRDSPERCPECGIAVRETRK